MRFSFDTWGEGCGGKPPVILLHSMVEDRRTWRNIGPDIAGATGRKVYAVDFRHHGPSPSSGEYGPRILVADLEDFMEQQNIGQAALVGHSLGGMIAAITAISKPAIVEKLVLEETPPLGKDIAPPSHLLQAVKEAVGAFLDSMPPAPSRESALQAVVTAIRTKLPKFSLFPSLDDNYDRLSLPFVWDGTALSLSLNIPTIISALEKGAFLVNVEGRYEGETLIINGEGSHYTRNSALFVSRHFPRERHVRFPGGGHFVHHEFPREFTEEIVCFLNTPSSSRL